jgi:hypothetical protein
MNRRTAILTAAAAVVGSQLPEVEKTAGLVGEPFYGLPGPKGLYDGWSVELWYPEYWKYEKRTLAPAPAVP